LNALFAPNQPPLFGFKLSNVGHPSSCVLVAELADQVTEDHFAPMYWGSPPMRPQPDKQLEQWNNVLQVPKSLDLTRHPGGSNYMFADLHTQKKRLDQLWHQEVGSAPDVDAFRPDL
jgi:prepilin-type processing-associated H-X9-DG protein